MPGNQPSAAPLTEATFFILLSLSTGSKHGYAILKHVEALSEAQVSLSASTLYTALLRLQDQGLIKRIDSADAANGNPGLPRKAYALTGNGLAALEVELARLTRQVRAGWKHLGEELGD